MTAWTPLPAPERALAIGAHPDDVEFGCGATLARWAEAGTHVELLVLTDGSKGTWDPDHELHELVDTRRREQRDALRALGAHTAHHLDFVDGELEVSADARRTVCEMLRTIRPDVVLGHDPWKQYRLHPDHHTAGRLTIDGIVAARDPHFFPTAGVPHRPSALLLFEAQVADHFEPARAHLDHKIRALLCHRSQWRSTMGIDEGAPDANEQQAAFASRIVREAETAGADWDLGPVEAFKRITDL